MIRDGFLTYPFPSPTSPSQWFTNNILLSAILFCTLAPFLIYLVTTLINDLFFGIKKRDLVHISNLHLYLLTISGPLTIAAALFRSDTIDRYRFRGAIPPNSSIGRHATRIRPFTFIKAIVLLAIPPLTSILILTFPRVIPTTLTFRDVNFSGVSLSINSNSSSSISIDNYLPISPTCSLIPILTAKSDDSLVDFSICTIRTAAPTISTSDVIIDIHVDAASNIITRVSSESRSFILTTGAFVQTKNETFQIQHSISSESINQLIIQGTEVLSEACPDREIEREFLTPWENNNSTIATRMSVRCSQNEVINLRVVEKSARAIIHMLTFVGSPSFKVHTEKRKTDANSSLIKYSDATNLPFVTRNRPLVPIGWLVIATIITLVLRVITLIVVNNDIGIGVDAIVKSMVGVDEKETLIRVDGYVRYNHKYQVGKTGHYGVERPGMEEVSGFNSCVIGGDVDVMAEILNEQAMMHDEEGHLGDFTDDKKHPHEFGDPLDLAYTELL